MSGSAAAKAQQQKNAGRVDTRSQEQSPQSVMSSAYDDILALQQCAGNQAVHGLVEGGIPPVVQSVINSGGQPLEPGLRSQMESRFGQDFSQVRVHTDARAEDSAKAVSAMAYTIGHDMVFDKGRYAPGTREGKRLLAHELAHVVQQRRGGVAPALDPGSPLEQFADNAAASVGQGSAPVQVAGASAVGLARQAQTQPVQTVTMYEYIDPSGNSVRLTEKEYQAARQRAMNSLRSDFNRIGGYTDTGFNTHKRHIDEWHVENLTDVFSKPRALIAIGTNIRAGAVHPTLNIWAPVKTRISAGLEALDRGDLRAAAIYLKQAADEYQDAKNKWNKYIDQLISGGEKLVGELEVVRDVSFAIALMAAAVVAAPVVAGGVAAAEFTGVTATAATALGTGAVVGTGGAVLRGSSAAGGSYLAQGQVNVRDVKTEAGKGAKEGFVTGITAGTGAGAGKALQVGVQGVRGQLVRRAAAEGIAGATGETTSAGLEGKSAEDVLKAGGKGLTFGAAGGALGAVASRPGTNPLISKGVQVGVGAGVSGAGTYVAGGSKEDVERSTLIGGASALALASAGHLGTPASNAPKGKPPSSTTPVAAEPATPTPQASTTAATPSVAPVAKPSFDVPILKPSRPVQGGTSANDVLPSNVSPLKRPPNRPPPDAQAQRLAATGTGDTLADVAQPAPPNLKLLPGGKGVQGSDVDAFPSHASARPPGNPPSPGHIAAPVPAGSKPPPLMSSGGKQQAVPIKPGVAKQVEPAKTAKPVVGPVENPPKAPKAEEPTKPPLQLPIGDPDFSNVTNTIKNVPEGKGPVVGQKLGAVPPGKKPQSAPAKPRKPETPEEKQQIQHMQTKRTQAALEKLKDVPDLQKAAASDPRLAEKAENSPSQLRELWKNYQDGRAKGDIKSENFGDYVQIRDRHSRGTSGEYGETFGRGAYEIVVKSPKLTSEGKAATTEPGSDMITYHAKGDRIKLLDNKAVKNPVGKVSALEKNLPQNLADDIADINKYAGQEGVPPEIKQKVLPRMEAALKDVNAYMEAHPQANPYSQRTQKAFDQILRKHGIDRVVTFSSGGPRAGISGGLRSKGFQTP